jgi:hypothetical protein
MHLFTHYNLYTNTPFFTPATVFLVSFFASVVALLMRRLFFLKQPFCAADAAALFKLQDGEMMG